MRQPSRCRVGVPRAQGRRGRAPWTAAGLRCLPRPWSLTARGADCSACRRDGDGRHVPSLWAIVEGRRSMPQAQPACLEHRTPGEGGRAHDTGLTPGREGPFRASPMMRWVDARTSKVTAVREPEAIPWRSWSPVCGHHDAIAGMPGVAEAASHQPFSVDQPAAMPSHPGAGY
jgi:hypothetical protein